jgi:predicted transposase YdaD
MKTLHTAPADPIQWPKFWNEEWLQRAIDELNTRKMTPEERFQFARFTAINAEAVNADKALVLATKMEAVKLGLQKGLPIELVAEINGITEELVRQIQRQPAAE